MFEEHHAVFVAEFGELVFGEPIGELIEAEDPLVDGMIPEFEWAGSGFDLASEELGGLFVGDAVGLFGAEEEIVKAGLFFGENASESGVEEDLGGFAEAVGEERAEPIFFDGGGEGEEGFGIATDFDLADFAGDEEGRSDHAFASESSFASVNEAAAERAGIEAKGDEIGKPCEDGLLEGLIGGGGRGDIEAFVFGDVEKLGSEFGGFSGGAWVDAEGGTFLGVEMVRLGEVEGAEVEEEVAFGDLAEGGEAILLHGFAVGASEEAAALGEGGDFDDGGDAVVIVGGEEHAGVAWVSWEGEHAASEGGDGARGIEGTEIGEEGEGAFEGAGFWGFEPAEEGDIFEAAGFESEDDFGEVEAFDLGQFLGGAFLVFAFCPEAEAEAWGGAAGATGALFGTGAGDAFGEESIDAAIGIEAGDFGLAGVDDEADSVDGQGGFCDIGGDDYLAAVRASDGVILFLGREFAMEREDRALASCAGLADGGDGAGDFVSTGHKD